MPRPTLKTAETGKISLRSDRKAPPLCSGRALWALGGSLGPLLGSAKRTGPDGAKQRRGALRWVLI